MDNHHRLLRELPLAVLEAIPVRADMLAAAADDLAFQPPLAILLAILRVVAMARTRAAAAVALAESEATDLGRTSAVVAQECLFLVLFTE
jgi:hypothetical protein